MLTRGHSSSGTPSILMEGHDCKQDKIISLELILTGITTQGNLLQLCLYNRHERTDEIHDSFNRFGAAAYGHLTGMERRISREERQRYSHIRY